MATANSTKRQRSAKRRLLIPAVGYIRMSSDKQEASPEQQQAEITKLADGNGYKILRWYVDDGIAGWKSDEREDFQRLIADVEKRHDFQAVLCWDQNRFSRFPPLEANHYWYLLDRAGVHLCTCNQGKIDWTSIAGWLTASIKQHADSQHRFQLSADVKRGKRARAERGEWQGKIPFGYVVVDCRLQLGDLLRVEIVQRIFREYIEGRSLRSIAHRLNDEGLHSLNDGRHWQAHSIREKLKNPVYAGIFRWDDIEIPDNHPAIVSTEDWETAQRLLAERKTKTTPKQDGGGFLFTGLLRCGKCNSAMHGQANGPRLLYYWCNGHKMKGKTFCDLNSVKQPDLFGCVVDAIEGHWMNPKVVKRLRDELHRQANRDNPEVDPEEIRKQLSGIEGKLSKAKRRLVEVDTDLLPIVQEHIRELRQQQEQLQTALRDAQTPRERIFDEVDETIERAMRRFSGLRETLRKATPTHQRAFFQEAIDRIDVWAYQHQNGHRDVFRLERGFIRLRSDNLLGSSD